jgi:NRPS condensation-like uncharacterized protein
VIVNSTTKSMKLNLFQQVMALWEEVGPYNAGYVFQLRGCACFEAMEEAVEASCREASLGRLVLDDNEESYRYEPAESIRVDRIEGDGSAMQMVCDFLEKHMNEPFLSQPHHPIRWAILNDTYTNSHFLVLVWRHLIADATSIRLLVHRVLARYYGAEEGCYEAPLRLDPFGCEEIMKRHYQRLGYLRTLIRSSRLYFRLRHVYRLPESRDRSEGSRVLLFDLPRDLLPRLIAACRRRKVTINDAFLAALGLAMARMTPSRQAQHRRRSLALATAVDLRQAAVGKLSNCFGLFVSYWVTLLDEPDIRDFEGMLSEVARQTQLEKSEKRFAGPAWDFLTLLLLRRWLGVNEDRSWYRKVYPLSAGLSNVRMSSSEFPGGDEKILACFLVPPTGPALPLVVSPATLGDRLRLSAVYRVASLSESQVQTLINIFLGKLEDFAEGVRAEKC